MVDLLFNEDPDYVHKIHHIINELNQRNQHQDQTVLGNRESFCRLFILLFYYWVIY